MDEEELQRASIVTTPKILSALETSYKR